MNKTLERRLRLCKSLPSLPSVAIEVLDLCQRAQFNMKDLARVISNDPALAAKILRVANSPLFNSRREVTQLSQALVWMGTQSVQTLALSFSLVQGLTNARDTGFDHDSYWKRSVLCAVAAQELARVIGLHHWEEVFLAALLQDIGMLALAKVYGEDYGAVVKRAQGDHRELLTLEREHFAGDHLTAGVWLARHWRLPDLLRQAIAQSHNATITNSKDSQQRLIACVTHSGNLARVWLDGDPAEVLEQARQRTTETFGIDNKSFDALMDAVAQRVPEVSALFELASDTADETMAILDGARETLVMLNIQAVQQTRDLRKTTLTLERRTRQLEERSMRDHLTGLFGRRRLDEHLVGEFKRGVSRQRPLAAIFCDIDYFKKVNDTYGHQAGDTVLVKVAECLKNELGADAFVARYGGEEFVIVLSGFGSERARSVAERLRKSVSKLAPTTADQVVIPVTASFGVSVTRGDTFKGPGELLQAADTALYAAKRQGRNRVILHRDVTQGGARDNKAQALTPCAVAAP